MTTTVLAEGYLDKAGKYAKSWKRRWFVLTTNSLAYFDDELKSETKGRVFLSTSTSVSDISETRGIVTKSSRYSFSITSTGNNGDIHHDIEVSTDNRDTINKWRDLLLRAVAEQTSSDSDDDLVVVDGEQIPTEAVMEGRPALSTNARIQRFVVSKLATSSAGQDLMTRAVGSDIKAVIDCFIAAVAKFAGDSSAAVMKEHCLKLACKLMVLFNDGAISREEMTNVDYQLQRIMGTVMRCIWRPPAVSEDESLSSDSANTLDANIAHLQGLLNDFHNSTIPLLSKHMSVKNSSRLTDVTNFFTNKEFLSALFSSRDFAPERQNLKASSKHMYDSRNINSK
mmetsp:Transcript_24564/g.36171  ORF Transcript_24564/g.36171 Transcript_24564/m.36171 type:complete len:340 (+) Transcript_24564:295-1314(+)|eukprot:CAMPEP_0185025962 /NCGR_PEP_ID=MMETSP1103-20130426/9486_1 /TAXON_ID=36769 /ORGANISM="Paraphysomonas bandaiensis, Strain Caron Lab Isolate" /LENGTH=339 /DNA_ID=CAMNT_0027559363 /DNA_START=229 /DNA_END=1248 /DNA_ORIENTATION=+